MQSVTVRVPASTSNLGPGFDTLGLALQLHNDVTISPSSNTPDDPFITEVFDLFFHTTHQKHQSFDVKIKGNVPRSSGLGSSVTVRLGILMGLNKFYKSPLSPEEVLDLTVKLEGHPDNAVPAFYGGFFAGSHHHYFKTSISPKLSFVCAMPSFELNTNSVRAFLPQKVSRIDAVVNMQQTSLIVAAFASKKYELLKNTSNDRLHQPYRARFIPGFYETLNTAQKNGALTAYLSGAGPTIMAVTLKNTEKIGRAMKKELINAGNKNTKIKILHADNTGAKIIN